MERIRFLRPLALAAVLAAGAAPALAQTTGMVAQPNPDADQLAQEIRVLAASPQKVPALLRAGELSVRLGDTAAAFAFFARAQSVDPANPRILAGRAMALVRLARPGEALRLFQAAEARGVQMRDYAADRGFAYDLLGQPLLAQRDYKLALQTDRDDETLRRYALSLGITGNVDEAMRQLDPLLRRQDRAAWRTRAFVQAMNGDVAGAERIASTMMPGNMGSALAPFFRRLATMAPGDRAFAAHFGEISPTPARLADARMAPQMAPYVPPQQRPVQVAEAQPPARATNDRRSRTAQRRASRTPSARGPAQTAAAQPPAPAAPARPTAQTPVAQAPAQTAAASPPPQPGPRPVVQAPSRPIVQPLPSTASSAAAQPVARGVAAQGGPVVTQPQPAPPVQLASAQPSPAAARPEPQVQRPVTQAAATLPVASPAPPGPARAGEEDSVLASIVANLTIPARELEVVSGLPVELPPSVSTPARAAAAAPTTSASAKATPKPEAAKPAAAKPDPKTTKKPEPKAKPEPSRIWVQVASGANEESLNRAWNSVVAKAPAAFKGKTGWSLPVRATNRVLAGPFKTNAEAQAFVNTLAKSDVSAFVFTSEAGQKVTKLAAK